jgi:hypothetical protein
MNARERDKLTAAHRALEARNEADAHWHADTYIYWRAQSVPPKDPRWMAAWLSTHSITELFPNARNPREQREYRLAQLKDAYYDSARLAAWRALFAKCDLQPYDPNTNYRDELTTPRGQKARVHRQVT